MDLPQSPPLTNRRRPYLLIVRQWLLPSCLCSLSRLWYLVHWLCSLRPAARARSAWLRLWSPHCRSSSLKIHGCWCEAACPIPLAICTVVLLLQERGRERGAINRNRQQQCLRHPSSQPNRTRPSPCHLPLAWPPSLAEPPLPALLMRRSGCLFPPWTLDGLAEQPASRNGRLAAASGIILAEQQAPVGDAEREHDSSDANTRKAGQGVRARKSAAVVPWLLR
ncbi:hypothetical protein FBU59_001715 [Linderina macrospora]|uniref:Uncharacterized protein n=1 Tax=Linderina macrospora TaxID=4868 RepID=A0ACC1JDF7_9FUNG|nr:hypothetical protein FBU59_001715 [Linderina macrospora]